MAQQDIRVGTSSDKNGEKVVAAFHILKKNIADAELRFQLLEASAGATDWGYLVTNAQYTGVDTVVASGIVRDYTLGGNTIYRLVTTAFGPIYPVEDSFYDDFDGVNLTNLIATRGV